MIEISTELIKEAVYKLCYDANICLNPQVYNKIYEAYKISQPPVKKILRNILQNAKTAYDKKLPLCQDTGQVIVFVYTGQNIVFKGEFIEDAINDAVEKCYRENFFRKSVVNNAIFDRTNTRTNTPCIIHTKYIKKDEVRIKVLIKGAGSENKSKLAMLLPTSDYDEAVKNCADMILESGVNACPPMFIGIGIGSSSDEAMLWSKEALLKTEFSKEETDFAEKVKALVNSKAPKEFSGCYVLDVKVKTGKTHIACMPVGICINCHSNRYAGCIVNQNGIKYQNEVPNFICDKEELPEPREIYANDISSIKALKAGEEFCLTGEIYVARDMAHKRISEMMKENKPLPFDLKDKIIMYAGPCPARQGEITGSIGPTTASRMDKYASLFYGAGMLASIGKGDRSDNVKKIIEKHKAKYFTVTGGIAAFLADKVTKSEIMAFEDLETEALYKLEVKKIPLKAVI